MTHEPQIWGPSVPVESWPPAPFHVARFLPQGENVACFLQRAPRGLSHVSFPVLGGFHGHVMVVRRRVILQQLSIWDHITPLWLASVIITTCFLHLPELSLNSVPGTVLKALGRIHAGAWHHASPHEAVGHCFLKEEN